MSRQILPPPFPTVDVIFCRNDDPVPVHRLPHQIRMSGQILWELGLVRPFFDEGGAMTTPFEFDSGKDSVRKKRCGDEVGKTQGFPIVEKIHFDHRIPELHAEFDKDSNDVIYSDFGAPFNDGDF